MRGDQKRQGKRHPQGHVQTRGPCPYAQGLEADFHQQRPDKHAQNLRMQFNHKEDRHPAKGNSCIKANGEVR